MARRKKQEKSLTLRQIRNLLPKLGEPCHVWSGGKDEFAKPPKGSVSATACQTSNCMGAARHETHRFLRWFWKPNSFYCRWCHMSRGLIVTALTLLIGLVVPLSLPTFGFWPTLGIFLLLGAAIIGLPPLLMKPPK